jgi:hypothetical protein
LFVLLGFLVIKYFIAFKVYHPPTVSGDRIPTLMYVRVLYSEVSYTFIHTPYVGMPIPTYWRYKWIKGLVLRV